MKIVTADITGSLIVNGVDVTSNVVSSSVFSGSIAGRVTSLEQFSASLDATFATDASVTASILVLSQSVQTSQAALSSSYTATSGSYVAVSGSYVITSGSYAAASASLSIRVTNTEATASTNTQASASFAAYSGSMSTRLTTDETNITTLTNASASFAVQSASLSIRVTNLENTSSTVSSSFATTSGSLSTRVTNLESTSSTVSSSFATTSGSLSGRVTIIEGQYATTGSNIFTGTQRITEASNAISFTSTASLYTDGGLRVSKDSYVSGTAYFNNVVVYGTSSIQYITSSQVNFGTNIITVNTDTPAVRFGGLAVFDSGSTQLTGSMLWDSEKNNWIYSNPSGSTYNSAMLMNGPRNTGSLGNEQGTTSCYLMAGQGGDHITSSQIYHDSTITCIGNSKIAGNFNVAGNSCLGGGSFYASTDSTFLTDKSYTFRDAVGITNPNGLSYCSAATTVISVGSMSNGNSIITTGNVGIGTACPSGSLHSFVAASGDNNSYVEGSGAFLHIKGRADYAKLYIDGPSAARWSIGTEAGQDLLIKQADSSTKLTITTAGIACFASTLCANYLYSATSVVANTTLFTGADIRKLNNNQCIFFKNAAGDNEMTIAGNGSLGIGTISPAADLQVNKNCDVVVAISNCVGVISGNRGGLAFYNCATSTVALIRAGAVTDNVGTELQFHTRPAAGNLTQVMTLGSTGVATFACQICASGLSMCGNVVLSRASTSAGANIEFRTAGTLNWYLGTRGLTNNNFYIVNEGLSGLSNLIIDATTGTATFACSVGANKLLINCTGFNSFGEHLQLKGCARFFGGQLRISNTATDDNHMFLTHDDTNGYICICRTVYAGNLILSPYGGVGINTSSITGKLSINSGISTSTATVMTLQQATNGAVKDAAGFGLAIQNGGEATNAADLIISTATGGALCERMRITSGGVICFNNTVCAPVVQQPTGFTVYSFPVNYGANYADISSGNYLSIGGTEPGTCNSYCAYAHGGINPRAVASNTEGMTWTCLRFVLRAVSPVGEASSTPTYLQTAGYFYVDGWYGICTCTNIAGIMDGSRGYSTVVLPWIPFSTFVGAGDVTGFGIKNVGPTTTRIGSVWIQYK